MKIKTYSTDVRYFCLKVLNFTINSINIETYAMYTNLCNFEKSEIVILLSQTLKTSVRMHLAEVQTLFRPKIFVCSVCIESALSKYL